MPENESNQPVRLDTPEGLLAELRKNFQQQRWISEGKLFCPSCCAPRRVQLFRALLTANAVSFTGREDISANWKSPESLEEFVPSLLVAGCLQCTKGIDILLHKGPEERPNILLLPRFFGGAGSAEAPESVSFYLDQAYRAHAIGANSAAVAMYRSALDQLLYQQGFATERELGRKIEALKSAIKDGSAPPWALQLGADTLTLVNALGKGAVHAKAGNVTQQKVLDDDLVRALDEFFQSLLYEVYERDARSQELEKGLANKVRLLHLPSEVTGKKEETSSVKEDDSGESS